MTTEACGIACVVGAGLSPLGKPREQPPYPTVHARCISIQTTCDSYIPKVVLAPGNRLERRRLSERCAYTLLRQKVIIERKHKFLCAGIEKLDLELPIRDFPYFSTLRVPAVPPVLLLIKSIYYNIKV